MNFPSTQDVEALDRDEQIDTITKLRLSNRIHEMASGFGFKSSSMYYNWLKKLQIYEDLCTKKNVFNPPLNLSGEVMTGYSDCTAFDFSYRAALSQDGMKFNYNLVANGDQTAALLRKIAAYIEDEKGDFTINLNIKK